MSALEFSLILLAAAVAAGFLGSLTGLGGGVVVVPFLTLAFGVDIRYAIGASLVSVIATSSGAASAYVREGFTNIRIGMLLEIATTLGALTGAFLASVVTPSLIAVVFGVVLVASALMSFGRAGRSRRAPAPSPGTLGARLGLQGEYPSTGGPVAYQARAIPGGFGMMGLAGALSGLLGIGSGAFKVIALDRIMRVPFKVSTATSNFMIGVTAAASAGVYLHRGYLDPGLTMPIMLGVLGGSILGTRVLVRARTLTLRRLFAVVIFILGMEMIYNGLAGKI
jgi:uncharacterized membrane protein YfcA